MNFFDYVNNDAFFKPLTLKYKRIYYDCIQIIIDKTKELPVLYESDAKYNINIYLKNVELNKINDDCMQEDNEIELTANNILNIFYEYGWLAPKEIGRNGQYVVNVTATTRRLMDFLKNITEKNRDGAMSNHIFSMYEIVKSAFEETSMRKARPFTNILKPLIDEESSLKNELIDLKESISKIMKNVILFQDINSFGCFIDKDDMLNQFFSDYFFIKNNGLIPTQISFIKNKLRILKNGDTYSRMVNECIEKYGDSIEEAKNRVDFQFAELENFLCLEYVSNMELIDNRINNYYNLANTRIALMVSNGVNLEGMLNDLLNIVANKSDDIKKEIIDKLADCCNISSQEYIGYKSFEKITHSKNKNENIGLKIIEETDEEKKQITEELYKSVNNRYSINKVSNFIERKMSLKKTISIEEIQIKNKEEALMYVAAMLYAGNEDFPYLIELSDQVIKTEIVDITNFKITKK